MMSYVRYYFRHLISWLTYPCRFLFRVPTELLSAPRRIGGLSLPMRVAVLVAICLPLLALLTFLSAKFSGNEPQSWNPWVSLLGLSLLVVTASVLSYYAVRWWLEPEESLFPDIDAAFKDGLAALAEHGVDPARVPIILMFGPATAQEADAVVAASGLPFLELGAPKGQHPLRWYVREDALLLAFPGIGCGGRLNALFQGPGARALGSPGEGFSPTQTVVADTLTAGMGEAPHGEATAEERRVSLPASRGVTGTLVADAGWEAPAGAAVSAGAANVYVGQRVVLGSDEMRDQRQRLHHALTRLRQLRQPLCTMNGTLCLLPWAALESDHAVAEFGKALRADLEELLAVTELRAPTVMLVHGLETEPGFLEIIRGVGLAKAKQGKFGKGCPVQTVAEPSVLEMCGNEACHRFESFVYQLFARPEALAQPQKNGRLFRLLCKIRTDVRSRFGRFLTTVFRPSDEGTMIFGGCYFAACGAREGQRAFAGSVLDMLIRDYPQELQWTDAATQRDRRYEFLSNLATTLGGLLLFVMIGLLVWVRWPR